MKTHLHTTIAFTGVFISQTERKSRSMLVGRSTERKKQTKTKKKEEKERKTNDKLKRKNKQTETKKEKL